MAEYVFEASEVRVDEYRHGQQSNWINQGYNAIRLTHIPTGITIEAHGNRSQHVNRHKAFDMLNDILFKHFFFEMSNLRS